MTSESAFGTLIGRLAEADPRRPAVTTPRLRGAAPPLEPRAQEIYAGVNATASIVRITA
jgi:hypothetical protein